MLPVEMEFDCLTYFNSGGGGRVIAGKPSQGNGSVSIPVHFQLPFGLFSLYRIIDFSIARVLPKLRKMWLVLLKDNTKEVNKRRREFKILQV